MAQQGPSPYKPLMLIGMLVMGLAVPWYYSYEPVMEEMQHKWGLMLLLLPLVLLLALFFLASSASSSSPINYLLPPSDSASIHRVGGSPLGLAALLVLILVMVWYHSGILKSWNPLIRT